MSNGGYLSSRVVCCRMQPHCVLAQGVCRAWLLWWSVTTCAMCSGTPRKHYGWWPGPPAPLGVLMDIAGCVGPGWARDRFGPYIAAFDALTWVGLSCGVLWMQPAGRQLQGALKNGVQMHAEMATTPSCCACTVHLVVVTLHIGMVDWLLMWRLEEPTQNVVNGASASCRVQQHLWVAVCWNQLGSSHMACLYVCCCSGGSAL